MNKKTVPYLLIVLVSACAALVVCPFIGMEFISPFNLKSNPLQADILLSLRIPRTLMAFFAGGGLALCGLAAQAMFRNPLVEPFTLGIAGGASCGAALVILSGLAATLPGIPLVSAGAFIGAVAAILLVYGISRLSRKSDSLTLLLAGIAVSFMFSSLLMFIQYTSDMRDTFHIVRWLMGGLDIYGYSQVVTMVVVMSVGTALITWKLPELNHLLSGEDIAGSRGVNVAATRKILLTGITLMVGSIVSYCGPIGFVGLMVPHVARRFFPLNHSILGPVTFCIGGTFLLICDTFARTLIAPTEIPVGVITALIGAPFFLWILTAEKKGTQTGIL